LREPGPITTDVDVEEKLGRSLFYNTHRWLWVPAFAGTTAEAVIYDRQGHGEAQSLRLDNR
jgi:hypothetical protein